MKFKTRDELNYYLVQNNLAVNSDGAIVRRTGQGIIPEVLAKWFADRVHFKNLMKKYVNEGNTELAEYYDRRQHIQKIFLNSMYGVLGLPVFRFYDVDNAAAVTVTGQDVIKSTAKVVNKQYERQLMNDNDYVIYIDTDSIYASASPLFDVYTPETDEQKKQVTIQIAREMETKLNKFYDIFAKKAFNIDKHEFFIKGESVAKTGFWVTKKRYALDKVYDLETNQDVSKTVFKGLDVVRSSFPKAFREFTSQLLKDILKRIPKEQIDQNILDFKMSMKTMSYLDMARNTSANNISGFVLDNAKGLRTYRKGTPAHIKAAITYNRLLEHFHIANEFAPVSDGEKIKYVYLTSNPLKIETVAIKGYNDPPQILELIDKHLDTDASFDNELRNKLEDFYSALRWGNIPTKVNQNAQEWFSF